MGIVINMDRHRRRQALQSFYTLVRHGAEIEMLHGTKKGPISPTGGLQTRLLTGHRLGELFDVGVSWKQQKSAVRILQPRKQRL